jgi:hypothetical protein
MELRSAGAPKVEHATERALPFRAILCPTHSGDPAQTPAEDGDDDGIYPAARKRARSTDHGVYPVASAAAAEGLGVAGRVAAAEAAARRRRVVEEATTGKATNKRELAVLSRELPGGESCLEELIAMGPEALREWFKSHPGTAQRVCLRLIIHG